MQKDSIMQSLKAKLGIGTDRKLTIQLPEDLPQGKYEVVLSFTDSLDTESDSTDSAPTGFVYALPPEAHCDTAHYDIAEPSESNISQ